MRPGDCLNLILRRAPWGHSAAKALNKSVQSEMLQLSLQQTNCNKRESTSLVNFGSASPEAPETGASYEYAGFALRTLASDYSARRAPIRE